MTQQSFDEMLTLLDEVMNEINEDDGVVFSPVEVSVDPCVLVPSSPEEIQSIEQRFPPEIRNNDSVERVSEIGSDSNPPREEGGLPSRFPDDVDAKRDHCCVKPLAR